MKIQSMFVEIKRSLAAFIPARSGNVAVTFGLALLPIVGFVGSAVDFSRGNSLKAAMQNALDATALMVGKTATGQTQDQIQQQADTYFKTLFTRPEAKNIKITATYSTSAGSQVVLDSSASMDTSFMGVFGVSHIDITASSTAKWGITRLRVALALDNTGSMAQSGKMTALKKATHDLLTQLKSAATVADDVYVSIIPFSKDVSIDPSNYKQAWLNWTPWNAVNGSCSSYNGSSQPQNQTDCLNNSGSWKAAKHKTWNGCLTDRDQNYDQQVDAPDTSAKYFVPEQYSNCPVEVMGLSNKWDDLNKLVDDMTPVGNTNQPIGLVWAWQSLVGGGPLTAPAKDAKYQYSDIIILMSDGLNTEDRWSTSQSAVDKRMYDPSNSGKGTCANIKAAGVTIYTIQVNTGGDPLSTLMQNCASGSDKTWMVTSSSGIGTVFNTIGTSLTKLRVAK